MSKAGSAFPILTASIALSTLIACVNTLPTTVQPLPQRAKASTPASLASLHYSPLQTNKTKRWRFKKGDPQILVEGTQTCFTTFKLPTGGSPLRIKIETSSSFEVPHYPVKYLFCPRILLLDADYEIVYSSDFDDLRKRQLLFGEPRFILEHTLPFGNSKAKYLLVIRERDFDGQYVKSSQPVDAPLYDELLRRERERIYSSPTGPVRITLK